MTPELPTRKPKLPPVKVVNAVNQVRSGISKLNQKMVPPPIALLSRAGFRIDRIVPTISMANVIESSLA